MSSTLIAVLHIPLGMNEYQPLECGLYMGRRIEANEDVSMGRGVVLSYSSADEMSYDNRAMETANRNKMSKVFVLFLKIWYMIIQLFGLARFPCRLLIDIKS
jgi:hypothetical protein